MFYTKNVTAFIIFSDFIRISVENRYFSFLLCSNSAKLVVFQTANKKLQAIRDHCLQLPLFLNNVPFFSI